MLKGNLQPRSKNYRAQQKRNVWLLLPDFKCWRHSHVRWRVAASRPCSSNSSSQEQQRHSASSMLRHLTSKIKSTGPISVAEYMRELLTNPVTGYYVCNDMLGPEGDFITSPEISQIFGELLGVWCVSEWMGAGSPRQLQLVELGPGRGSLASDVLRVFGQLRAVLGETSVSVHLVEVSPVLSQVQATCLTGECNQVSASEDEPCYRHGTTAAGLPCSWYRSLEHVPRGFSIYLAHEFFDALPIHKFQRTERGWREVMVDIDPEKPDQLRFVIIPNPTLACTLIQADEKRQHVEVCPEGGVIIQQLANRIAEDGGAALIADYGHDGTKMDTFRGFKGHQLHDVLSSPGAADLTADVDFSYLRAMAEEGGVACLGPVTQRLFLKNMGIDARLQVLLRNCTDPSTKNQLIQSYDMLTNPSKMGERFHFFSMLAPSRLHRPQAAPQGLKMEKKNPAPLPVAGFTELNL